MLDSLEIKNFRTFDHLVIEKLGRVNLITGKNNVGKTTLLEALDLYANVFDPKIIVSLLSNRNEAKKNEDCQLSYYDSNYPVHRRLFHNYHQFEPDSNRDFENEYIEIGTYDEPESKIKLRVVWINIPRSDENYSIGKPRESGIQPGIGMTLGSNKEFLEPNNYSTKYMNKALLPGPKRCIFLPANGLDLKQISIYWDQLSLTDLEEEVHKGLRVVDSRFEKLSFINFEDEQFSRIPIIKMRDFKNPVPLKSVGEGMNRLLGLLLALVHTKDGMLLIDEFENGLHYTVQPEVWKIIFELSERLNVQVFATTHSWDCIKAFQQASSEYMEVPCELIRLTQKNGKIYSTIFEKEELEIVSQDNIEVR